MCTLVYILYIEFIYALYKYIYIISDFIHTAYIMYIYIILSLSTSLSLSLSVSLYVSLSMSLSISLCLSVSLCVSLSLSLSLRLSQSTSLSLSISLSLYLSLFVSLSISLSLYLFLIIHGSPGATRCAPPQGGCRRGVRPRATGAPAWRPGGAPLDSSRRRGGSSARRP